MSQQPSKKAIVKTIITKTKIDKNGKKVVTQEVVEKEVDELPSNIKIVKPPEGPELSLKEFSVQCVEAHNKYRRLHGVPELKYSEKLTADAKKWADTLASRGKMEHTTEEGVGENLAWSSAYTDPKQPVKNWYDEINDYDFSKPGFKSGVGHFTQLVWKSTNEMGAAVSRDKKGGSFVVARYLPQGNITNPGYFEKNVTKPKK